MTAAEYTLTFKASDGQSRDLLLHPVYITRVAGEPAGMLRGLSTGATARLVDEITASRAALAESGKELAEILENLVPDLDHQTTRAALNLRRSMFNGRATKMAELQKLSDVLDAEVYAKIEQYGETFGQLRDKESSIDDVFEGELTESTAGLLEMLDRPNFSAGLSYSNAKLFREFRERLPLESPRSAKGKTRRNLEDSLLQYGARVATKTSPLSSFTVLGVDRWGHGSDGLNLTFGQEVERRVSFKGALFKSLSAALLENFDSAVKLAPLEINPSAVVNDTRIHLKAVTPGTVSSGRFWGTGEDRVETANNPIMMLISSIFDAHDGQPIAAQELAEAVQAKAPKLEQGAIWQFLTKLYKIQYLRPALKLFDQDDQMEAYCRLLERVEGELGKELSSLAQRMKENAEVFHSGDDIARSRAIGLLHADVQKTSELLELDPNSALSKPVLFENCYVKSTGPSVSWADFEPYSADLELLLETAVLTDSVHHFRSDLADFFIAEYGGDGECSDVEAFLVKFDDIYRPGRFDIEPGETRKAPQSETTTALGKAISKFQDYLEPFLREESEARLDADQLKEVLASVPEQVRNRGLSQSYLLQLANNGNEKLAIVNQIFGGRSALMSRFLEVLDERSLTDVRTYVQSGSDTGVALELPGVFGFNANQHPKLADAELTISPFAAGRSDTKHVDLATTSLKYDADRHSVYFETADGVRFDTYYQGFLIPTLMPSVQRVLALTFGDGPSQFAITAMLSRDIVKPSNLTPLPRLRLGSLVLSRRMWIIPFDHLPDIDLSPVEYFVAVQSWRAANNFPNEAFIRIIPIPDAETGSDQTEGVDWHKFDFKNIKPFYVELDSPRFVRLMQRSLKRNSYSVSLTEVLPTLDDQHVKIEGKGHVAELQIELTRPARLASGQGSSEGETAAATDQDPGLKDIEASDAFEDWSTIRIAYFDGDKSALLLGPIKEAIAAVRKEFATVDLTLQTQWKFGPHVELHFCPSDHKDKIVELVKSIVEPWLADNPSTEVLEPEAYLALSKKIGMSELEAGPYEPLLINNSISCTAYKPSSALRISELVESKNSFLSEALDITLDLLALKQADADSFGLTLIAMMSICGTTYHPHGLSKGFMSFRSHAEYFFAAYDGQGKLRTQFDALNTAKSEKVDRIVDALASGDLTSMPVPDTHQDLLKRWQEVVHRTAKRNDLIVAQNHERLLADETFEKLVEGISATTPIDYQNRARAKKDSDLGVAFEQEEGLAIRSSVEFMAYRTTVNFFYLLLPTLGVSPVQKFCYCHLLANGAERHFKVDWREIVGLIPATEAQ